MKFLLVAVNAKYIHSNLGIYSLKKYADERRTANSPGGAPSVEIELAEYTINHQMEYILQDIYQKDPDAVGFSCYIWNILSVMEVVRDLKKVKAGIHIWLGGPEVSFNAEELLTQNRELTGILAGEGEECFCRLVDCYGQAVRQSRGEYTGAKTPQGREDRPWEGLFYDRLERIPGLFFHKKNGEIAGTHAGPALDLSEVPFSYGDLSGLENRIIYYESSRGCPFSCSYCLSSIDKSVRLRDPELVKKELDFFLERRVPQVKFVDRTFNCNKRHAVEIWRHILEHDNGVTNFHFEISADLLDEEELELMSRMRPGLIQLEIGVQTTNPRTIKEIRRRMDLDKLKKAVAKVNSFHNIHQHLDLIAGLPYEDYESFGRSFDEVYAMEPEQLQLGFLKVLRGSYMEEMAESYGLLYHFQPPYEVLSTSWLSFDDCIRLKGVEEMVEVYYNSGQFRNTLRELAIEFPSPFCMYEALALHYKKSGLFAASHSRIARYEILYEFIRGTVGETDRGTDGNTDGGTDNDAEKYRDLLMYDLYLRENVKSRPSFARDQTPFKEAVKQFFIREAGERTYLPGYEGYDSRQMAKMAHIEVNGAGEMTLFDYRNRDALLGNARTVKLGNGNNEGKDRSTGLKNGG